VEYVAAPAAWVGYIRSRSACPELPDSITTKYMFEIFTKSEESEMVLTACGSAFDREVLHNN